MPPKSSLPILTQLKCLEGIRCAIRIACIFHMELERNAFVQSLARFTLLTANSALTEMKAKNVDTIKTLILVAHTDGNYLGASWLEILRCISQLELAQLIGTGVKTKYIHPGSATPSGGASGGSGSGSHSIRERSSSLASSESGSDFANSTSNSTVSGLGNVFRGSVGGEAKKAAGGAVESLGETSSQSVVVAVDRIFTGSVCLDGNAIVDFVKALVDVSHEELSMPAHPRMFSLQKLVEISYYNMGRIRLQWSRVWSILGAHFNEVGRFKTEEIAQFAVDSLRQLSMKFLERGELPNFRFQKDFMRPFEYIMKHNDSLTIRDMIVRCMAQMVNLQQRQIRSGWKNIFAVFHMAAADGDENIVDLAFQTTNHIVADLMPENLSIFVDSFQEAVKCLAEFACNSQNPDMSMEAIDLIRRCANYVATKPTLFTEHPWEDTSSVPESERIWMRGWFPIIFEMSCIVVRCKLDVRTRALSEMFVIMKTYGDEFKPDWWRELFTVSCRIFDVMKLPEQQTEKAEWLMTTCNHALLSIVDVFSHYYSRLHRVVLKDLYDRISWCAEQDNEQLAKSGIECLGTLVTSNGVKFTQEIWDRTSALMLDLFRNSVPHKLLTWEPENPVILRANPSPMIQQNHVSQHSGENETAAGAQGASGPTVNGMKEEPDVEQSSASGELAKVRTPSKSPSRAQSRQQRDGNLSNEAVFRKLQIKCVVQLELIQVVDLVIFGGGYSRRDDERNANDAKALVAASPIMPHNSVGTANNNDRDEFGAMANAVGEYFTAPSTPATNGFCTYPLQSMVPGQAGGAEAEHSHRDSGLYQCLNPTRLFSLVDCLMASHDFAKQFNTNQSQRNLLWKAGFKGRDRPNLLSQEKASITCALRILFKMYAEHGCGPAATSNSETAGGVTSVRAQVESRLLAVCGDALWYYTALSSQHHRDAWTPIVLLIFCRTIRLPAQQFRTAALAYHRVAARLVVADLPPEVRCLLAKFIELLPLD